MDVSEGREDILLRGRACFSPSGFRAGMLLLTGRGAGVGVIIELPLHCGTTAGSEDLPTGGLCCFRWGACGRGASEVFCDIAVVVVG
jgi:hypothetical protein